MSNGFEPIADDEILYRRIPVSQGWYDPQKSPKPAPEAFRPSRSDTTGISLSRAKHVSLDQASKGPSRQGYFVVKLRTGDLRAKGIEVVPDGLGGVPGHAEIKELRYDNGRTDQALEMARILAEEVCGEVLGPFVSKAG